MNYRIDFQFNSSLVFDHIPVFDALLAYAAVREELGEKRMKHTTSLSQEEIEWANGLIPLHRHEQGWFYGSWLLWDKEYSTEGIVTWKKRWADTYDHLADFGKNVRKVRISGGPFKSYDVPMTAHDIAEGHCYFRSDDVQRVELLLRKHIYGIGKKLSQGYGEIETFTITAVEHDPFEQVIRPMPAPDGEMGVYMAWRPPYWEPKNFGNCKMV